MQQTEFRAEVPADSVNSVFEGLSGFIVVRLTPQATHPEQKDLRALSEEFGLRGLARFLARHDEILTQPVVQSVSPEQLLALEQEVRGSEFSPLHSLTAYWRLDCRALVKDIPSLVMELNELPEIDLAHAELQVHEPLVNAADDPFAANQNYLDAAPTGIDARWAWTQNRDGAGVAFIDLEQGWITSHEDLVGKTPTLIFGDNRNGVGPFHADHGTAVLGEVVAVDNTLGVVGIATGVTSVRMVSHWDTATATALHVASAIVAAIAALSPGDVLLLEVARGAGAYLPTETNPADFDAIRLAVAHGIVVIEAGGNGGYNLDTYPTAASSKLNRGNANFADSGAIMVGAASSTVPHNRLTFSCYGSRIDCYGWGENVTTAGYGDLNPAGTVDTRQYTGVFNGTSSASPIVAGAALIVQGAYKATAATPLSPAELRGILANPANGTAQGTGTTGNIGVMPNLRQILSNVLGVLPDVYLRDAVGDSGAVPSAGLLSISPDIICTPAAVADPTASFGEGSGTENVDTLGSQVEHGQDNFIYVRMRNRGAGAANGVTASVYWSEVATLITPNMWNLIDTTAPVNVPQGNTLVVTDALTWAAANLPAAGDHACFVAILNQAQDPAPPPLPATDWDSFTAFIRNNNNVAWRNFDVVDVQPDPSADPAEARFLVAGPPDNERVFDLHILQNLPGGVQLWWEVPMALYGLMRRASFRKIKFQERERTVRLLLPSIRDLAIRKVRLGPNARFRTRLLLHGSKDMGQGWYRIAISQRTHAQEVGRVTLGVRATRKRPTAAPRRASPRR
jgi:hypothetical protein